MPPRRAPRKARKPRYGRRHKRRNFRRLNTNMFALTRSVAQIGIKGTGAGTVDSTNTNMLNLGTPVSCAHGTSNCYDIPFSLYFRLDQLVSYTELTVLADYYKILKAVVTFATSNSFSPGQVSTYIDYNIDKDDAAVPSISDEDQKSALRQKGFNQFGQATLYCAPKPVVTVYPGSGTASYALMNKGAWIDCNNISVPHYGIKGIFRNVSLVSASSFQAFSVRVRLTVAAKGIQ